MRKIHLDVSDLRVESFSVNGAAKERGTVQGREWTLTCFGTCGDHTCACTGQDSCSGPVDCLCESVKFC